MAAEKLTKRVVDSLKPRPAAEAGGRAKEAFAWDRELRGFGVQVMPSGLKSFVVQYRTAEGRARRMVIGRYGLMTVEQARLQAHKALVAVAEGADPAAQEALDKGSATVAEICDWYLTEAKTGLILGRSRRPIKASTLASDAGRIEAHIRPLVGARRVKSLTLGDIAQFQADVARGATVKLRTGSRGGHTLGGEGAAARTLSTLHSVLQHAVRLGLIDGNPAKGVRRLASQPRDRRLSAAEITALGSALHEAHSDGAHPVALAAVKLLLLTGFRRQEALGLRHEWIDATTQCVRFPDTKSGAQVRVIGRAAADYITSLPMREGTGYVFPADSGDGHFTAVPPQLARLCHAAKLADVTPHTLRHTFASVAGELGFSELTIAALLGHSARGVTQRYVHIDEAVRLAADRVSDRIAMLLSDDQAARAGATSKRPVRRTRVAA